MNIVALIQARMSSSRLPGKVLLDIVGEPMLLRVVERVRLAARLNQVVVATTTHSSDDALADFCKEHAYPCFRGNLHDVLDRFYQAARSYSADAILRITADCPVIDSVLIDEMVTEFCAGSDEPSTLPYDFAANRLPPPWKRTFPIGLDLEMCTFAALERAWKEADQPYQREHVMPFFYEGVAQPDDVPMRVALRSPRGFRVLLVNHSQDFGKMRWTVDTPQDLELIRQIYAHFEGRWDFSWQDVLALVERHPDLIQINASVTAKHVQDIDHRIS